MGESMTDPQLQARALWCRLVGGETLSAEEQQALHHCLRSDPEQSRELREDATLHAMLLSLEDVEVSEGSFVAGVLERCGLGDQLTAGESAPSTAGLAPTKTIPPPVQSDRGNEQNGLSTVNDLADRSAFRRLRQRKKRNLNSALAIGIAAALLIGLGVYTWFNLPEANPVADTTRELPESLPEPSPTVDGSREPEQVPVESGVASRQLPAEGHRVMDPEGTDPDPAIGESPATPYQFVTLTKVDNPVWEQERSVGERLGDEIVRLFGGEVELTFDDGAVVKLAGPVEFQPLTSGQMRLRRGSLSANVPAQAIGFTVATPTSRVIDYGTEFDVSVTESGASDVLVRKGEVEVEVAANTPSDDAIQKWRLVPDGLDRASFYARVDSSPKSPVSATARSASGQFQGVISVDGRMVEFTSATTFDNVHQNVIKEFSASSDDMLHRWSDFVDSMQDRPMQGSVNVNGVEVGFGNLREVMRLQEEMQQRFLQRPNGAGPAIPNSSFSGSININGKVTRFTSREEYEAARRKSFGAAAAFGAGEFWFGE